MKVSILSQYCSILSKVIYRLSAISNNYPMACLTELEHNILLFVREHKRPWIAKTILPIK
ncbi:hypothetical protein ANAPC4_01361 [Anaplasma phagocytophilum]|nr:hypothetical protein ANAPC4_01361 [Anaplasma phagocytophilum]